MTVSESLGRSLEGVSGVRGEKKDRLDPLIDRVIVLEDGVELDHAQKSLVVLLPVIDTKCDWSVVEGDIAGGYELE